MTQTLLRGGRVIDPGTGTDDLADLLIDGDRIAAVGPSLTAPDGATVIDVTGRIVGPGFIDLHSHVHSIAGQRLQAFDGVTTTLDLESGLMPIGKAYADAAAAGRPLHYGFSASWSMARATVLLDGWTAAADFNAGLDLLGNPGWQRDSTDRERGRWLELLSTELADGALGIGILMGYAPRTDPAEFLAVARLASTAGVPTYTHVREIVEADPTTPVDGSLEIVRAAAETGAAMHHCHVNSTSRQHIDRVLETLATSVAAGSRVTVEAYPYGSGATGVGAFFLDPDRLPSWGLEPRNIVLLPSGERIADVRRLREVRATAPGTTCVIEYLDESDPQQAAMLQRALAFPDSIVASDAMPVHLPDAATDTTDWPLPAGASTHPRTAGTYARSIRQMVITTGIWTWLEAFRRCALLPARVLHDVAPAAHRKGHLGIGADADIVVLDPGTVCDHATYLEPVRPSTGVDHLFVAGTPVIRDCTLDPAAFPGRPLRGELP